MQASTPRTEGESLSSDDQVGDIQQGPRLGVQVRNSQGATKASRGGRMISIELPTPSGHAHNKGHWRAKARPIKAMRELAYILAKQAIAEHGRPKADVVEVRYFFRVPDRRRRDAANMIQQCKPYIDGIVDSGLITGDHWEVLRIIGVGVMIDKEKPGVTLRFEFLRAP